MKIEKQIFMNNCVCVNIIETTLILNAQDMNNDKALFDLIRWSR